MPLNKQCSVFTGKFFLITTPLGNNLFCKEIDIKEYNIILDWTDKLYFYTKRFKSEINMSSRVLNCKKVVELSDNCQLLGICLIF